MFIIFKTEFLIAIAPFYLGKHIEMIRIKIFLLWKKKNNIFIRKRFRGNRSKLDKLHFILIVVLTWEHELLLEE